MSKDFYKTLGVSKNATAADMKKAYRKLAVEFHPDKNKSKGAEDKFKEINEAYEILSNPQKKQQYDQFGDAAFQGGAPGGGPFAGAQGNPFGNAQGKQGPFTYTYTSNGGSQGGEGFSDPFDIFEQFFGGGSPFGRQKPAYTLQISFMDAVNGMEESISMNGKKQKIKIPAGVNNESRIRFNDFDIVVQVRPHSYFRRQRDDIVTENEIPMITAVLGGTSQIETLDGVVKLKIPQGTQPGSLIRIKGKGVKHLRGNGHGDHFVRIKIVIPRKINSEQKDLLQEFEVASKKRKWF